MTVSRFWRQTESWPRVWWLAYEKDVQHNGEKFSQVTKTPSLLSRLIFCQPVVVAHVIDCLASFYHQMTINFMFIELHRQFVLRGQASQLSFRDFIFSVHKFQSLSRETLARLTTRLDESEFLSVQKLNRGFHTTMHNILRIFGFCMFIAMSTRAMETDFDPASQPMTRDLRIVGGSVARQNQFPHSVALILHLRPAEGERQSMSSFCGGSVIHASYILTVSALQD